MTKRSPGEVAASYGTRPVIFVAGPDRSGTTMLTLMLSAHSRLYLPPEMRCIYNILRRFAPGQRLEGELLDEAKREILEDQKLRRIKLGLDPLLDAVAEVQPCTPRELCLWLLCSLRDLAKPEADIVGHKKNYLELGLRLKAHFPEAKLVTIFRDPRDAVPSAAAKLPGQNVPYTSRIWRRRSCCLHEIENVLPGFATAHYYEHFVMNPEEDMRNCSEFLGLPFEREMLEYWQANRGYSNLLQGDETKHARTSQPLDTSGVERWRRDGAPASIRLIESICGGEMSQHGYILSRKPGIHWRLYAWMCVLLDACRRVLVRRFEKLREF